MSRRARQRPYEPKEGFLSGADLYRAACAPVGLPDNFTDSLLRYIVHLEVGHEVYVKEVDNWHSPAWGVGLRSAVGEAAEWLALSDYEPDHPKKDDPDYESKMMSHMYFIAGQHEKRYCANTLLRRMVQSLCRNEVSDDERVL